MPITSQTLDVSNTSIVTFYEFANNSNKVVSDLHFLRDQANSALANTNAYIATKLDSSSLNILTVNHIRTANTGSASLPTYSFTGDINTGIWRSASDTVAFTTGGTNRLVVNTSLITTSLIFTPSSDDGAALGTTALKWSDLYLASGGVVNFNNGDVNITHLPNQLVFSGAASGYVFDSNILPSLSVNLGGALNQFSNLFLASGGGINFNNGDVTVTHSSNVLTFAGASTGYTFDAPITGTNATFTGGTLTVSQVDAGATAGPSLILDRDSSSPSSSDVIGSVVFKGRDSGGNTDTYVAVTGQITDATSGSEDGLLYFQTVTAGVMNNTAVVGGGAFRPATNDVTSLGASGTAWSDLYLASGGAINFNNSDVTVTHGTNSLAFAGASNGYSFDNKLYFTSGGGFDFNSGDVTITHSANTINFTGATAGYFFNNGPITATNANTNLTYADNGATGGPNLYLYRNSLTPAASDKLGVIWFDGRNSALSRFTYSMIDTTINTATASSERATMTFYVADNGSLPGVVELTANGIYMPVGGIILDGGPLIVDGATTLNGGAFIGGANYTSFNGTPISTLTGGSTFGGLIEGANAGHLVLGIRDNEGQDSVSIVSRGGDDNTATLPYDTRVAAFRSNGIIEIFGQLKFPATQQASSDANTLDDYEEGTFTPIWSPATNSFTSITYDSTFTYGHYTKIGRMIYIYGRVRTTALTIGTATGALRVGGLPFTVNSSNNSSPVFAGFSAGFSSNQPLGGLFSAGTTLIQPYGRTVADGASVSLAVSHMNAASTNDFIFAGVYYPS